MVLDTAVAPVEGLIVDSITGGVGFRNHTVPVGIALGAEWTEALLWIQPETACVDRNISVEFRIPLDGLYSSEPANICLTDNGGFANLVPEWPHVGMTNPQKDLNLEGRAYKAAWMVNAYTMLVMNLTRPSPNAFGYLNSTVGNKYPASFYQVPGVKLNGIYITDSWKSLLDPEAFVSNYSLTNAPDTNYINLFNISYLNYSDISLL